MKRRDALQVLIDNAGPNVDLGGRSGGPAMPTEPKGASLREQIEEVTSDLCSAADRALGLHLDATPEIIALFVARLKDAAVRARRQKTPYFDAQADGFESMADELEEREGGET